MPKIMSELIKNYGARQLERGYAATGGSIQDENGVW